MEKCSYCGRKYKEYRKGDGCIHCGASRDKIKNEYNNYPSENSALFAFMQLRWRIEELFDVIVRELVNTLSWISN